jgi:transducin (beta)-like 1
VSSAIVLLRGHEKEVYGCLWNPMQNMLVSGSSDSTARIWEIPDDLTTTKASVPSPRVLNHGSGAHKDVTTLEWNVSVSVVLAESFRG